jgi:radical SAM superfamily enzyme YgiQ (UPF0313 family)
LETFAEGGTVKTLLIRPGAEVVEKTLKGPWPPELMHLEKLYSEPGLIFRGLISFGSFAPSSVLAVGSILRNMGEEVEFLDVPFEFGIPLTEELNRKRQENIEAFIAQGGFDVVGISCTSVLESLATQKIAQAAKRALEDVTVVVGGYQAASDAVDFMEKVESIDVVVLSDFECVAEQLYHSLVTGSFRTVPHILYRKNGTLCRGTPCTGAFELPAFDYTFIDKYVSQYSFLPVEASRGCPFQCSFCQEKVVRPIYRVKDAVTAADQTLEAAAYMGQVQEPVTLCFSDALWGLDPEWVNTFCSHLINRTAGDTFGWGVESRIGQFNEEQLSLMKKAGCFTVGYGVESLSPKMLNIMNKTRNPQEYVDSVFDTVEKMLKVDMHTVLLFILGMPGETPSTLKETVKQVKKLPLKNENLHLQFGLPVPLRGTGLEAHIHDPQFVKTHGVKILGEFEWEKTYLPRFTLLFDPSSSLSASEMTETFLDIVSGIHRISASLERQSGLYEEVKTLLERDQISPQELEEFGRIYRRITTGMP